MSPRQSRQSAPATEAQELHHSLRVRASELRAAGHEHAREMQAFFATVFKTLERGPSSAQSAREDDKKNLVLDILLDMIVEYLEHLQMQ